MDNRQQYLKLIFGKVCSGKNTYAAENYPNAQIFDIGEIVRQLTQVKSRTHDHTLDQQIIAHLIRELNWSKANTDTMVIVGIRQLSILKAIEKEVEGGIFDIERIWLEVPEGILKARYADRAAQKDTCLDFETAIKRDSLLGLDEVVEYLHTIKTIIIENYNRNEDYIL